MFALLHRTPAHKGWTFIGTFRDPPPAPAGMVTETREDSLLGIVTEYRFVPAPRPADGASRTEAVAFFLLAFICVPPLLAATLTGFF